MSLQTRIERAEAEAREQAWAEFDAADEALMQWARANSTPEEYDAFCRVLFGAPLLAHYKAKQAAGDELTLRERAALALCEQLGPLGPGDQATADALAARVPELMQQLKAACKSPLLSKKGQRDGPQSI